MNHKGQTVSLIKTQPYNISNVIIHALIQEYQRAG